MSWRTTHTVPDKGGSFFDRHWRGELPLWVSYWVMSLPVTVIAGFLPLAVFDVVPEDDGFAVAVALVSSALIIDAACVWLYVGTWRSAGNHLRDGGKVRWAYSARAVVAFGMLAMPMSFICIVVPDIRDAWASMAQDAADHHRISVVGAGTELTFEGRLDRGVADEIEAVLSVNPRVELIHLNSPGGNMNEALRLRDIIAARGLITYADTECASACAFAFIGGQERYLAYGAKLGFNRARKTSLFNSPSEGERRDMLARGLTPRFVDGVMATPSDSMWWPAMEDLFGGKVINAVATVKFAKAKFPRRARQNL